MIKKCAKWQKEQADSTSVEALAAVYARCLENALKIATCVASNFSPTTGNLTITALDIDWAIRLSKANIRTIASILLKNAGRAAHKTKDEEFRERVENVLSYIKEGTRHDIMSKLGCLHGDPRLTKALRELKSMGMIREKNQKLLNFIEKRI